MRNSSQSKKLLTKMLKKFKIFLSPIKLFSVNLSLTRYGSQPLPISESKRSWALAAMARLFKPSAK